ncbi:hypothetical protein HHK36_016724 [Tetracentron sinense]|uniref:Uncharacterized protein n=1 Tax=Tetracentron sinense TaxID=13715 RepID=A0A835DC68_TETSI|nr:hypothetical protein HHK36_016724 [Tetracentron sinense]
MPSAPRAYIPDMAFSVGRRPLQAFLRRVRERRAVCSGSLPLKAKEKGVVALNLLYFPYLFISTNKAVVNMISNLVNSTVPIAVEIFKKARDL